MVRFRSLAALLVVSGIIAVQVAARLQPPSTAPAALPAIPAPHLSKAERYQALSPIDLKEAKQRYGAFSKCGPAR